MDEALVQFDESVSALEREGLSLTLCDRLARTLHSMKGSAAALGFAEVAEFVHHVGIYVKSLRTHERLDKLSVCKPLVSAKNYIHDHIESLRENKKPPSGGEFIVHSMEKVLDPQPVSHVVKIPREPLAGDIWLMSENFELELFEMPEPEPLEVTVEHVKPTDPEQYAIQREILRLTQLAAAVNLNTVLAAQSLSVQEGVPAISSEWSLSGMNVQPEEVETDPCEASTVVSEHSEVDTSTEPLAHTVHAPDVEADASVIEEADQHFNDSDDLSSKDKLAVANDEFSTPHAETQATTATVPVPRPALVTTSEPATPMAQPTNTIQVSLEDIDELLSLTEELVTLQNIIDEHKPVFETPLLQKTISRLSKLITQTQELSMSMKMVDFSSISETIAAHAHRQSVLFHKSIETEIEGGNTEIDKSILDAVAKPLALLISNAVEHGIESEDERVEKGKTPLGKITVSLRMTSKEIIFEVCDDGRGLDIPQIRKKAIACGLMARLDRLPDEQIRSFIFHPGFTTRPSANDDDESQGLGLHHLSTFAHTSRGRVEIDSIRDQGTVFRLVLPQSVSVIESFIVKVGKERFVIPKDQIIETISSQEAQIDIIQGHHQMLNVRGTSVPLIQLSTILRRPSAGAQPDSQFDGVALIAQEDNARPFAVIVDDVVCQKKVVIKSLGRELQGLRGLTGAAILGDGKPSIILDLHELIASYQSGRMGKAEKKSA